MDLARIAELLRPFLAAPSGAPHPAPDSCHSGQSEESVFLSAAQLQNISTYIDVLLRWSARINLTAIRDPEEIVTRHFGESLFAARCLFAVESEGHPERVAFASAGPGRAPARFESHGESNIEARSEHPYFDLLDLGSGAGFPGLPIKIWAPALRTTLIESNQKKATFLREAIRKLTLTDIDVFCGRAETFPRQARVVTLRAVERFEAALPIASRLVAPEGRLVLLIGSAQAEPARKLLPSFCWSDPFRVPLSASRIVLIGKQE